MLNWLLKKDNIKSQEESKCSGVTNLVVSTALDLTKDIEEKARLLKLELMKLENSRIGHH